MSLPGHTERTEPGIAPQRLLAYEDFRDQIDQIARTIRLATPVDRTAQLSFGRETMPGWGQRA